MKDVLYSLSLLLILCGSAIYFTIPGIKIFSLTVLLAGIILLAKDRGLEAVEEIIALAANVISYARVGVLAAIHVTLARLLVNVVAGVQNGIVGMIIAPVLFLLGAALILASSTFIVFIQSLRLHYLEFFRRFYSGKGEILSLSPINMNIYTCCEVL